MQVCKILVAKGFKHIKNDGDHRYYEDQFGHIVQVDMGDKRGFGPDDIKLKLQNSGLSREEFYGATKETAKKIGIRFRRNT